MIIAVFLSNGRVIKTIARQKSFVFFFYVLSDVILTKDKTLALEQTILTHIVGYKNPSLVSIYAKDGVVVVVVGGGRISAREAVCLI